MRRPTWMSAVAAVALLGCSSPGNIAQLESQLRQREDMIAALENQLAEERRETNSLQTEVAALRDQVNNPKSIVHEQAAVLARVEKIDFHRLLTSGLNQDEVPGDERLSVLLMPLDADGDLIKLPGQIELEAFDYTFPEGQQRIGYWKFPVDQSKQSWHRGFTASGYLFELPWQNLPASSELTLHGRLTAPDGRVFEKTMLVAVRPEKQATPADTQPLAQPVKHEQPAKPDQAPLSRSVQRVVPPVEVPISNGLPTSDRYRLDDIPVRR